MVFAALTTAHLTGLLFAPTAERRNLCFLGVAISGCAMLAYLTFLDTADVIPSTYGGRPFEPLRYVLWAHTTPAMALNVAAPYEGVGGRAELLLTRGKKGGE